MNGLPRVTRAGRQDGVGKPELILRYQREHMIVCMRGRRRGFGCVKPGGTAGEILQAPVPAETVVFAGTGAFLYGAKADFLRKDPETGQERGEQR